MSILKNQDLIKIIGILGTGICLNSTPLIAMENLEDEKIGNYLRAQRIWNRAKLEAQNGRFETFDQEARRQHIAALAEFEKSERETAARAAREAEAQAAYEKRADDLEYKNRLEPAR
jgi:hypothetical protein